MKNNIGRRPGANSLYKNRIVYSYSVDGKMYTNSITDAFDLEISKSELDKIYELFKDKNKEEIAIEIIKVCNDIYDELISEKDNLKEYINKNIGNIIDIIANGIKQNTLDKVFIIQKFVEE